MRLLPLIISHLSPISQIQVNLATGLLRNRETGAGVVLHTLGVVDRLRLRLLFNEFPAQQSRRLVHSFGWVPSERCRVPDVVHRKTVVGGTRSGGGPSATQVLNPGPPKSQCRVVTDL